MIQNWIDVINENLSKISKKNHSNQSVHESHIFMLKSWQGEQNNKSKVFFCRIASGGGNNEKMLFSSSAFTRPKIIIIFLTNTQNHHSHKHQDCVNITLSLFAVEAYYIELSRY